MVYCKHDVNHQSITDLCQDENDDSKDCDSDLNVARDLECPMLPLCCIICHLRKRGKSW